MKDCDISRAVELSQANIADRDAYWEMDPFTSTFFSGCMYSDSIVRGAVADFLLSHLALHVVLYVFHVGICCVFGLMMAYFVES